jgi:hypothetical protein
LRFVVVSIPMRCGLRVLLTEAAFYRRYVVSLFGLGHLR